MKLAICDNDPIYASALAKEAEKLSLVSTADSYSNPTFLPQLLEGNYDVILMDIDWESPKTGIHFAADLYAAGCPAKILFITSFTEKYVEAAMLADTNAIGFLNKPVSPTMLGAFLEKAQRQISEADTKVLTVKINGKQLALRLAEIFYIESQMRTAVIFTEKESYSVSETMSSLENRLPDIFVRCHRGYILNMEKIRKYGASSIELKNNQEIPIGRKYHEEVKKKYLNYLESKM